MTNERLIQELIEAAYETGYYSGKLEDGQEHHLAAIERREKLRRQVLLRLTPAAPDAAYCECKEYINEPMTTAFRCISCGKPPRR